MLLNKQSKSNITFGLGYNNVQGPADYTSKASSNEDKNNKQQDQKFKGIIVDMIGDETDELTKYLIENSKKGINIKSDSVEPIVDKLSTSSNTNPY